MLVRYEVALKLRQPLGVEIVLLSVTGSFRNQAVNQAGGRKVCLQTRRLSAEAAIIPVNP